MFEHKTQNRIPHEHEITSTFLMHSNALPHPGLGHHVMVVDALMKFNRSIRLHCADTSGGESSVTIRIVNTSGHLSAMHGVLRQSFPLPVTEAVMWLAQHVLQKKCPQPRANPSFPAQRQRQGRQLNPAGEDENVAPRW